MFGRQKELEEQLQFKEKKCEYLIRFIDEEMKKYKEEVKHANESNSEKRTIEAPPDLKKKINMVSKIPTIKKSNNVVSNYEKLEESFRVDNQKMEIIK